MKNLATFLVFLVLLFLVHLGYGYLTAVRVPEMDASLLTVPSDLHLNVTLPAASSSWADGRQETVDVKLSRKQIDAAADLGADLVRVNLVRETLEQPAEVDKLQQVAAYARSKHLQLIVSYLGREAWFGSFASGSGKADWGEFKKTYLADVVAIMDNLHPDYLLILPDCPYFTRAQVKSPVVAQDWFDFAKDAALMIKQKSFSTKVMVEGELYPATDSQVEADRDFLERVLSDNDPTFDIISLSASSPETLERGSDKLAELRDKYHWHGEAWLGQVDYPASSDAAGQKDYFLYALYLTGSHKFTALGFSTLSDGGGKTNGLLTEDLRAKEASTAVKQVMHKRQP